MPSRSSSSTASKYAFPAQRGEIARGIPTAHAAPPLDRHFAQGADLPPVWPDPAEEVRGTSVDPLHRMVPFAIRKDPALYELLSLIESLRDGRARERQLTTDPAAAGIRPTNDVDAITDVTSYAMYAALSNRLRAIGLLEDKTEGAPACRWRYDAAIVDIMPTERSVLGVANSWYGPAMASAESMTIAGLQARIVTPAYFLATRLEAFHARGHADVVTSSDLEDLVMVVDGRPQLLAEVERADPPVRQFIASEVGDLMDNRRFTDGLAAFLHPDRASQARRPLLEQRLHALAALQKFSRPA